LFLSIVLFAPNFARADSVVLAPNDFFPLSDDALFQSSIDGLFVESGSPSGVFYAPVKLPEGAKITSVVLFYKDDSSSGNIEINLWKKNIYTLDNTMMATWTSSADTAAVPLIHKLSPIYGGNSVNNGGYFYIVRIQFSDPGAFADCMLYAVKIMYK